MNGPRQAVLAVNAGSSTLKFALYPVDGGVVDAAVLSGMVDGLDTGGRPAVHVRFDGVSTLHRLEAGAADAFAGALDAVAEVISRYAASFSLCAIAHRIVHGGARYRESVLLDDEALAFLDTLSPLAPLHQPHNLDGVRAFRRRFPHLPQVGCFDTAFHAGLAPAEYRFALPGALADAGIRRYGFHGLSYRYVSEQLARCSGRAGARVLIAHLGNGASACAVLAGASIATTMGFSALDGLVMGSRCGALDPGVLLHLLRQGWTADQLEQLLYRESGLRGVSGLTSDMRELHASTEPDCALAIDLFVHRLVRECGALVACLGGLDVLAFTGGIGEHDAAVRQRLCAALGYLNLRIDHLANRNAQGEATAPIHASGSACEVWVVPTDEGRVAAADCARLLAPARSAR